MKKNKLWGIIVGVFLMLVLTGLTQAADVITNGTFDADLSDWFNSVQTANGTRSWDGTVYGVSSGSMRYLTDTGRRKQYQAVDSIYIPTVINQNDAVTLSLYWYKYADLVGAGINDIYVYSTLSGSGTRNELWSETSRPNAGETLQNNVVDLVVTTGFPSTGNYYLVIAGDVRGGNNTNAYTQFNLDDIILDVQGAANAAPTVTSGATQVSPSSVNRFGANNTVISTDFTDTDDPGVGAFNVTFKIREPNNSTEVTLVNNLTNGSGGLTITSGGGGSYTASYSYNPDDAQTIGLYDLYFEVSDGTDNAIDPYDPDNLNELDINEVLPNSPPTVTSGATQVSPASVNRWSTNTTVISTDFNDTDQPGVGAFNVTLKIREPNDITELTLVNNQPNGGGGLTIVDNGGGSYTASYTYNPDDAQTTGLYDLYFEVSDGTDNAIDPYDPDNLNELTIFESIPNNIPQVTAGATQVSVSPVNRWSTNSTVISTDFSDSDDPGVGAFNVTFKIREPNNSTELTLVNNLTNGSGGLTITSGGGGAYTASYTYNPDDAQAIGLYDLYFEVTDGSDTGTDDYADNLDELEINEIIPNNPPTVVSGATSASPSQVYRSGTNTSTISTVFTDLDDPGIGAFNVTIQVRKPDNSTVEILVDNLTNGNGGLTITSGGGGKYTASYSWDPANSQTTGFYDLYFGVSDGTDNVTDDFTANLDELEVTNVPANQPPTVVAGATAVSVSPVNRFGVNTTVISTDFNDADQPGVAAFSVTFKIREPNDITELTLVNNQANGGGGLTIVDNGGGSYTASYTYNPDDAQTLGLYDLYFEVSDGTDNIIDGYASNTDELEVNEIIANNAPTVVAGATVVSVSPVNRVGSNSTIISTGFNDIDQPGIGAFSVTFKIREPNDITELTIANSLPHGTGGMNIIDNGGGSYTAEYSYNPDDAQTIGLYDLYFEVTDGSDNVIDNYGSNVDELEINDIPVNSAPTVTAGATQVLVSPVNRIGANSTTISADFTDTDQPAASAFFVTFRIREPNDVTQLTLVNNLSHGSGGLTVIDNGGGSYTASYSYNPDDAQTLGLYDLYFEVSDGTDNAIDGYPNNLDELEINEIIANNAPTVTSGATLVTVSPVNRFGSNTTVISTDFTDTDQPTVTSFFVTFKIREPGDITEVILVNNLTHLNGGLTVVNNGGGSYTATYSYNPDDAQTLGLYDLYFEVSDGIDNVIDGFANNADEMQINEVIVNSAPVVASGAANSTFPQVNRFGSSTTTLIASFSDADQPGIGSFQVTFKVREPDNIAELTLANAQSHGAGGITITDLGGGLYTARYTYNPNDAQTLGLYDLYFEVSDGFDNTIDGYANNLDELEMIEVLVNNPPLFTTGISSVVPSSIDRVGAGTVNLRSTFTDADDPGLAAFLVTVKLRSQYGPTIVTVADNLADGAGGLTVTDNGGGSYTADIDFNPADNFTLGYYDLYFSVFDGSDSDTDFFDDNNDELLITNGGENAPPVVASDEATASPAGIERIGANICTISATFTDADVPGVGAFTVNFKLRLPDNSSEIILAANAGNGAQGVTITDGGGGIYTASVGWDPPDGQQLGFYDIYFDISDGFATSVDGYSNNPDEIEVYDATSNNPPTLTAGNTKAVPIDVNRLGSDFTLIVGGFSDLDMPGTGAFIVTIKVRDQASTEYTIVNAANHGFQNLRIRHLSGENYEASVAWNPPDGQVTGTYDLYMYVEDNNGAAVTDGYADNGDELTVSSAAILGDGYLLRRTHNADNCGGPSSACHNMLDHQSQDCLVCHTPHGTANIYLVRDSIQTPSSGLKEVIFKTLGIGDPYNDPDPTVGDPNSGVMADSTDDVYTGVCEVCHVDPVGHHRNDGSQPGPNHNDALDCTGCHPHTEGFAVSGGGESSGGSNCTCHASIFSPLNSSTTSYHHQINSDAPDYTISSRTCLTCHVDHNIFRPDLNVGFGARSKNLRADITTPVVQGSGSVLLNSDYQSSGTGGICLSCHTSVQTKGYTQPDGTTETPALSKSDYDAATSAHNYNATSTFSSDGSTFNANCVKCHNDNMSKSYQNSTAKFSAHNSDYRRILSAFGIASPADPLEEKVCFSCHSTTSNPNAGSNLDYYGGRAMTDAALGIETSFGYTYGHPTTTFSGRHKPGENAADFADGNRHAECEDCHNPHAAQQGTHDGSNNLVSNALKGAWGVEPISWPAAPVPTDNGNVFIAPTGYNKVIPAQKEYQICLKCHSNYTTLPSGARNLAAEINPNYPSTHGITIANQNPYCNTTTMFEPWGSSGSTYCSDCHRSSNLSDPNGPHGSNSEHLLVATIVSDDAVGTPLCYVCHLETVYWSSKSAGALSKYVKHPSVQGAHAVSHGCFACHMWDYASTSGLGLQTTDDLSVGTINVHGQNRKWVFNEQDGSAGSGDPADAFVNGYIANISYSAEQCWAQTCKVHSPQNY